MNDAYHNKQCAIIIAATLAILILLCALAIMRDARNEALSITLAPDRTVYRASYIGERYNGGITRSGERLDNRAYVCAVKRRLGLRWGDLLIAESAEDIGPRITVARVVDWLPDDAKSDIDLSEAAFAALAPRERGVVLVRIRRL